MVQKEEQPFHYDEEEDRGKVFFLQKNRNKKITKIYFCILVGTREPPLITLLVCCPYRAFAHRCSGAGLNGGRVWRSTGGDCKSKERWRGTTRVS